jgi:protein-disulfide isomerase
VSLHRLAPALVAVLASAAVFAQTSEPRSPISTNPADSPTRTQSGKVFASTDANRPPAMGPNPAKVVVVVFSDFQCPVCRRSADATEQMAEEFPEEVRVEFWQHALPTHPHAENAAVASLAAQRQGQFWEYHHEVFKNQNKLDVASLAGYAESLGLDMEQFKKDYDDPALRDRVRAESAVAEKLGATGTPAFTVNGKLNVGWGSWSSFRSNVQRELVEARQAEVAGVALADIAETRARVLITDPAKLEVYLSSVLAPDTAAAKDQADEKTSKKDKKKKKKATS